MSKRKIVSVHTSERGQTIVCDDGTAWERQWVLFNRGGYGDYMAWGAWQEIPAPEATP